MSEAQSNNLSDISSPIILNRSLTTEVVAADGQTVLLGGLIQREQERDGHQGSVFGQYPDPGLPVQDHQQGV